MAELRVAKAFIRRVAVYAEEHAIDLAAPSSEALGVRDSNKGVSQDGTSTALRIIKLQVLDLRPSVTHSYSCSGLLVHHS